MKLRLFISLLLTASLSAFAQKAAVSGSIVEADTGNPVAGALVTLTQQGISVTTGPAGDFLISNAAPGKVTIDIIAAGYADASQTAELFANQTVDLGKILIRNNDLNTIFYEEQEDVWFDEQALEEDEGSSQSITALTGASDDIYYNATTYNFQPMYFHFRGYDSRFQQVSINGIVLNDLGRGGFSYSTLGGMTSRAFRNRTNAVGNAAASFGFGDIGGATNFNTITSNYSPGFNGSVAFTNSSYLMRAMATYSSGINAEGWGVTVSAIGRYANEGVIPGTFYNSVGAFLSLEKVINPNHSLTLTAFAAPTQRASSSAVVKEVFELTGDNLYNPNWGYQDGKKRSSKVIEQCDPTMLLNWIFKNQRTEVNTGVAFRWTNYSSTGLQYYNAPNPSPVYYRYLPSYYFEDGQPTEESQIYADLWAQKSFRQIDWDNMYTVNRRNNYINQSLPEDEQRPASYLLYQWHTNQFNFILNSYFNHRINDHMTLQGGANFQVVRAHYYKTIKDMLGADFWLDIDTYGERDMPEDPDFIQSNLNTPNRRVYQGDIYDYDYDITSMQGTAWLQNMINLTHWDINYGLKLGYTQFFRHGYFRSGKAPDNSYGTGKTHQFDFGAIKAGATYKLDGRNFFSAHLSMESRAPLFEYAYISPRYKDTTIDGLSNEHIVAADLSYIWNYRRFRGAITGFWTEMLNLTERSSFYDDRYQTYMNYVLKNVHRSYKGLELGMAYKITPSITVSAAGTYSRYQYKNRPIGTRSYENGLQPDVTTRVYLKNFFVGGTPQTAANIGIDWAAPKSWFFNLNASWMGDAYVYLSPIRHEASDDLWQHFPNPAELESKMKSLAVQEKLNNAFVLNASIGKFVNLNRKVSLNFNLSLNNLLNNRKIMVNGLQQGRFDYTNYDLNKFPNKYSYAQGIRVSFNMGVRF